MASNLSDCNTNSTGNNVFKFKKLRTKENTIQVNVDNDGSNADDDNLAGCQNSEIIASPATSNTATKGLLSVENNIPQVRKRFVKTSEQNIFAIKENRFEKSTSKSTVWGVKIFKDWLKENDINDSFECLSERELDTLLARFYVELRKVDG